MSRYTKADEMRQRRTNVETAIQKYIKYYGKGRPYDEDTVQTIVRYLITQENRLCRIAEDECDENLYNKYWIDGVNPEQERLEKLTVAYIEKHIGCKCYTQRDPRGMMIRLYLNKAKTGYFSNSWDGETTGINW